MLDSGITVTLAQLVARLLPALTDAAKAADAARADHHGAGDRDRPVQPGHLPEPCGQPGAARCGGLHRVSRGTDSGNHSLLYQRALCGSLGMEGLVGLHRWASATVALITTSWGSPPGVWWMSQLSGLCQSLLKKQCYNTAIQATCGHPSCVHASWHPGGFHAS